MSNRSYLSPLLLIAFALPAFGHSVEVTASALNVRTGPSTGNSRIGMIYRGQSYPHIASSGSWIKIQLGDRQGWAHSDYLRDNNARPVNYVTASALNVRSGAGSRYRAVGTISRGTPVSVAGSSGSWRQISFNGRTAYVYGTYLSATNPGGGGGNTGGGSTGNRPVSRAGFIQLPNSGRGFYGYYAASKRWGTPRLVYGIERIAARFQREHPTWGRIGLGDISVMNGGRISGHASHQRGVDVDGRLMRTDNREQATTIFQSAYSRTKNQALLNLYESELNVKNIFFNDTRVRTAHRQNWPNHDNHYHVRIR